MAEPIPTNPVDESDKAAKKSGSLFGLEPKIPTEFKLLVTDRQNFALTAEVIFNHALARVVWNYRDTISSVYQLLDEIKRTSLESIATNAGLSRISDVVFTDGAMREFVREVQIQFIPQMAEFHTNWSGFISHLATALTNDVMNGEALGEGKSLVPTEITERQQSTAFMTQMLNANTWLIIYILILLWGNVPSYEEYKAKQKYGVGIGPR